MVGIVMRSIWDNDDVTVFNDMNTIMDWSFDRAQRTPYLLASEYQHLTSLTYKPLRFFGPEKNVEVPLIIKEDVLYYANSINQKEIKTEVVLNEMTAFELDTETPVGKLIITQRESTIEVPLYSTVTGQSIKDSHKLLYVGVGAGAFIALIVSLVALYGIAKFASRAMGTSKKRYNRY